MARAKRSFDTELEALLGTMAERDKEAQELGAMPARHAAVAALACAGPGRALLDGGPGAGTRRDFGVGTVSRCETEVWMRYRGKTTARPFPPGERVRIPGSKYTFRLAKFSPAGRIVEDYELTRARTASPVLRIATVGEKGEETAVWLRFGQPRTLRTQGGLIHVRFGRRGSKGGAGR